MKPCTHSNEAVTGEKGGVPMRRATKRKAHKGCSSASSNDTAAEKMAAVAGFSEAHKISNSKQKQEHEELACDIIHKEDDGELLSAEEFDAFIAMMEEKHERLWAEYTPDGVKVMEYKDYSSYPKDDDGFVVLRG